ncbi:MAG TPA: phosphatase PAP2 family protein [Stellaceae bacterium]|nr:phosphatase PAP2 family protein [Stellaceae bacterium]
MVSQALMIDITDLGNPMIVGAAALVTTIWLWVSRQRDMAQVFAVAAIATAVATTTLKLVSITLGGELYDTIFYMSTGAPSGHTALSAAIYGGIAMLFAVGSRGALRIGAPLLLLTAIIGVGFTRVALGSHTPADVVAGFLVGGSFAAVVGFVAARRQREWPPLMPLLASVLAVGLLLHLSGLRFQSPGLL